jgi:hypothetical protein
MAPAAGPSEEGGDDVGGVSVERDPGSVVAHSRAGVGMAGGFLHIAQWNPGVESSGDERVAQGVRSEALAYPGPSGDTPHDPSRPRDDRPVLRWLQRARGPLPGSPSLWPQ